MSPVRTPAVILLLSLLASPFAATRAWAASLEETQAMLLRGDYQACIDAAAQAIADRPFNEDWWTHKTRAHLAIGQYPQALETVESGLARFSSSIRLRLLARETYLANGKTSQARIMLEQVNGLVSRVPWRYTDAPNLVAQGEAALLLGADPRQVLEVCFDRARLLAGRPQRVFVAAGELGMQKHDYQLAARMFQAGAKEHPDDPAMTMGLARAYAASGQEQAEAMLARTLELNPNYVPAMLFQVDHLIIAEQHDAAQKLIDRALKVNADHPKAWAYRAVLAHLAHDPAAEKQARQRALKHWPTNPAVDHLIGRKLSQKYRFSEGAAYQRQALSMDANYLPARIQLAQDLLRLGQVEEGWQLAKQVRERDEYDVVAFNLATLQETLDKFAELRNDHFIVRMDKREAEIYGDRVMALLEEARVALCEKYDLTLTEPVAVEIFPDQKDFAIRTFGLPGGAGFLGVCFGKVITANSPASQIGSPSNWEAVLWHEFCHVVTLQATKNRMPRWLSEGISVYEELQRDPTWGQAMTPVYRSMILGGQLTPVSELSGAFLRPPSGLHLQFAYFEASLVVQYIIDTAGPGALRAVLADLGAGVSIDASLAKHVAPMDELEAGFEAFAEAQAEALAPDVDWSAPDLPREAAGWSLDQWQTWTASHPGDFRAHVGLANKLQTQQQWAESITPLTRAIALYPDYVQPDNPYVLLARAHRELGDNAKEQAVLAALSDRSSDAMDAYVRLMELATAKQDWPAVARRGAQAMAVNPLRPELHRMLALASEALNEPQQALRAWRRLLMMEPADLAMAHYRTARLMAQLNQPGAKRQVLMALEEAPRFRDAQRLLLSLVDGQVPAEEPSGAKDSATPSDRSDEKESRDQKLGR